jgi:hypothetical protein
MPEYQTRNPMKPISDAMRAWGEALRAEVEQWPGVTTRSSFGMTMVYRGELVFAALPSTRALHAEDVIMLKFEQESTALARRIAVEPHFIGGTLASTHNKQGEGRKWRFFRIAGDADIHAAIEWLGEAYQSARKRR